MIPRLPKFVMDSTTVGKVLPIFAEKVPKGMPLHAFLSLKDVDFKFGQFDTDIIIEYTACLRFREDTGENHGSEKDGKLKDLLYDELRIVTAFSVKTEQDILYVEMLSHKLDNKNKYAQSAFPVKDYMKISENEYREFLSTFGFMLNKQKDWLNDHVFNNGKGRHLPMSTDQIVLQAGF